eukprot:CAMPEP_0114246954 /NCGR_PEP_ID=MMETSP0058-20121206/12755_1 /TAXON_ID=36894 /ORGANISM="Pyramimonas parkeae, CCMP726" /LENGTH=221 /DNA_ID=CAMNT_0001360209 /DNA_START=67 /DNA_END=732 /DNA_ORIENTATION=-
MAALATTFLNTKVTKFSAGSRIHDRSSSKVSAAACRSSEVVRCALKTQQVAVLSTAAATLLGAAPAFADYSIFDDLKTSIDTSAKVEVPAEPAAAAIAAPEVAAVTAPEVAISSPSQSDAERRAAAEALKKELAAQYNQKIGKSEEVAARKKFDQGLSKAVAPAAPKEVVAKEVVAKKVESSGEAPSPLLFSVGLLFSPLLLATGYQFVTLARIAGNKLSN